MSINKLNKRNLIIILLLGFSSGLPLALTGATLQAWFTVSGASLVTIGMLGLIGQPYVLKFLWAPFLDRYVPPVLGLRRGWLLTTQFALLIAIMLMTIGDPKINPYWLASLALFVAFLSATQDIAVDAYRTDILQPEERGLGAALYTWGYRVAMLVSGGAALIFADKVGWPITYFVMAMLMFIGIITTLFAKEPSFSDAQHPQTLLAAIADPIREFFSRKSAVLILAFILFYKLGDALSVSLTTPFLIRGLGFTLTTVGIVYKGAGMVATLLGVLIAGLIMTRINLFRALFIFGVLQVVAIISLLLLAIAGKNYVMLVVAITLDNFCNGMGSVALVAFLMSQCDHRYTATQFALFSAFASVGRVFTGPIAGVMAEHMSWAQFFVWALLVCIPGLIVLWKLRERVEFANTTSAAATS